MARTTNNKNFKIPKSNCDLEP